MTPDEARARLAEVRALKKEAREWDANSVNYTINALKAQHALRAQVNNLLALTEHFAAAAERNAVNARRYEWLRNDPPIRLSVRQYTKRESRGIYLDGATLDAAIDAEMSKEASRG